MYHISGFDFGPLHPCQQEPSFPLIPRPSALDAAARRAREPLRRRGGDHGGDHGRGLNARRRNMAKIWYMCWERVGRRSPCYLLRLAIVFELIGCASLLAVTVGGPFCDNMVVGQNINYEVVNMHVVFGLHVPATSNAVELHFGR